MTRLARRRTRPGWVSTLVLALAAAALAVPATAVAAEEAAPRSGTLTDSRSYAHWAHPVRRSWARATPSSTAPRVARLRFKTEDGYPEVYAALRRHVDPAGTSWIRVGIPMRPNGTRGWVLESSLGPLYRVTTRLVVDRNTMRATLFRGRLRIWQASVGVGAPGTPTPPGQFWIREKFRVSNPDGIYGPRAFGTSNYSTLTDWPGGGVVGLHGTDQPDLIPGRPSHGCIRIRNADILRLYRLMPVGTPVLIR